jgi:hypothetical protein
MSFKEAGGGYYKVIFRVGARNLQPAILESDPLSIIVPSPALFSFSNKDTETYLEQCAILLGRRES